MVRVNRRDVLRMGGLAAAALGVPAASLQAQTRPDGGLPPSIASLSSMRGQARPISHDERLARLEKARRLMAASKIDAVLLTGGTTLNYFTGLRWGNSERLMALVVPAKGDPFVVCPAFEVDRLNEPVLLRRFCSFPCVVTHTEQKLHALDVAFRCHDKEK